MPWDRRAFLASSSAAAALWSARAASQGGDTFRPEDFGARGDGATNDTAAFAALSARLNRAGGGTIQLGRGHTYVVGRQSRTGPYGWSPNPIIDLERLTRPLRIVGNGARLLCQPGLKFGTFDPVTGEVVRLPPRRYERDKLAVPYQAMILIQDCSAPIEISDMELDGNLPRLSVGGPYGDTGWQIPGTGIILRNNIASEKVTDLHSHHHPQDGVMIDGDDRRSVRSSFQRLRARYNGRQGLSIVGGRGYDFADCEFSHTGRSAIRSAPGGGVDIEAEGKKTNRDLTFTRCKFIDNSGVGMVADSGDSEGALFTDCLFVGTTTWAVWPLKPRFIFRGCTFAGAVVHAFPDKEPDRATKFIDCRFVDDPSLSPTGKLFVADKPGRPTINLAKSDNVLFRGCVFDFKHDGVLPWSWRAIYADCTMSQASKVKAMTKGKYLGRTIIDAPVSLYGSMILGTVILNGERVPQGPVGRDVEPW